MKGLRASSCFVFCPVLLTLLVIASSCPGLAGQDLRKQEITEGAYLTLDDLISVALVSRPDLARSKYDLEAGKARIGQARSGYYPTVDVSAGYARKQSVYRNRRDLLSLINVPNYSEYTSDVFVEQNLYDFGRTGANVNRRMLEADSRLFDLHDTTVLAVYNVKFAYFRVLRAKRSRDVTSEKVEQFKQHLSVATDKFRTGKKSRYDVTSAEVALGNAKLDLIRAENELKLAWTNLNNQIGYFSAPSYRIEDNLDFKKYMVTQEEALEQAYRTRPDLRSLAALTDAAKKALEAEEKEYYPRLIGNAGYTFDGTEFPISSGWNAGLTMKLNVFEGLLTKTRIAEARANVRSLASRIDEKKLDIYLEVQEAYLDLHAAEKSIANSELQVRQATENLELVGLRYSSGLATPLDVTDATVSYSNAKLDYINALYAYKVAEANIEKAIGRR